MDTNEPGSARQSRQRCRHRGTCAVQTHATVSKCQRFTSNQRVIAASADVRVRDGRDALCDLLHLTVLRWRVLNDCEAVLDHLVEQVEEPFVVRCVNHFRVVRRRDRRARSERSRREVARALVERVVRVAVLTEPRPRERALVAIASPDDVERAALDCERPSPPSCTAQKTRNALDTQRGSSRHARSSAQTGRDALKMSSISRSGDTSELLSRR